MLISAGFILIVDEGKKESPSRCESELVISQLGLAGATCTENRTEGIKLNKKSEGSNYELKCLISPYLFRGRRVPADTRPTTQRSRCTQRFYTVFPNYKTHLFDPFKTI